jgi:hypothetical protein
MIKKFNDRIFSWPTERKQYFVSHEVSPELLGTLRRRLKRKQRPNQKEIPGRGKEKSRKKTNDQEE